MSVGQYLTGDEKSIPVDGVIFLGDETPLIGQSQEDVTQVVEPHRGSSTAKSAEAMV